MPKFENVLVLSASKYGFVDESTAELKEGVTVHFMQNDIKIPIVSQDGLKKGCPPVKGTFPVSIFEKFTSVPAFYDIEYIMTVGSDGKPKFTYTDVSVVKK